MRSAADAPPHERARVWIPTGARESAGTPDSVRAIDRSKLVSHRLRGFGPYENCRSALVQACASPVPYLEIDTRVAADGRIFVYHNPRGRSHLTARPYFAHTDGEAIRGVRYASGESLMDLEECLEIFTRRRDPSQRLCIDMKDFGFEREHLDLVDRAGLQRSTCWMSWVPQSLHRLREFGAVGPLILAHCNLSRLRALGDVLESALGRTTFRFSRIVLRGAADPAPPPRPLSHGFQHGLLCARLPDAVERLLASTGGGVCVHRSLVGSPIMQYCHSAGLQLWVFRVRTPAGYRRYARHDAVSVVFCDDAPAVLRATEAA